MKKNKIKSFDEYSSNRSNFVNERFVDGEEKEGEVAHSQLKAICDYAMKLSEIILPDDQLPGWVQSKLAVIAHDIDEVFHWIDAKILTAKGTAVYNEYEDDEYEDDEDGNEYEDDEDGNEYEDDEDGNEYEDDEDGNEYEDDEDGNEYEDDEDGNEYEDDDDEN